MSQEAGIRISGTVYKTQSAFACFYFFTTSDIAYEISKSFYNLL